MNAFGSRQTYTHILTSWIKEINKSVSRADLLPLAPGLKSPINCHIRTWLIKFLRTAIEKCTTLHTLFSEN